MRSANLRRRNKRTADNCSLYNSINQSIRLFMGPEVETIFLKFLPDIFGV